MAPRPFPPLKGRGAHTYTQEEHMSNTAAGSYDYDFAKAWMPKKGDVLEGKVASIDTGNSAYGAYPIITVEQSDGTKLALHAFHTAVRNQLAQAKPEVGQDIGIKYMGKKKSQADPTRTYDVYRVVAGGSTGGYDWSRETSVQVPQDAPSPVTDADDVPYEVS